MVRACVRACVEGDVERGRASVNVQMFTMYVVTGERAVGQTKKQRRRSPFVPPHYSEFAGTTNVS